MSDLDARTCALAGRPRRLQRRPRRRGGPAAARQHRHLPLQCGRARLLRAHMQPLLALAGEPSGVQLLA